MLSMRLTHVSLNFDCFSSVNTLQMFLKDDDKYTYITSGSLLAMVSPISAA